MKLAITTPSVQKTIKLLEENHNEFRDRILPEIEILFQNALKNSQSNSSIIFLFKMFQSFKEHFLLHMESEENELFKNIFNETHIHHDNIPDNLLLAIEKSMESLTLQSRSDLVLKLLHQKIHSFQNELKTHSEIEEMIFGN